MDPTRPTVAVVGCGQWGKNHVRNHRELGSLGLVCDPTPEGRALAARLAPGAEVVEHFEAVLQSNVQGVVLATPAPTHFELARRALEAGKDVLVEKPMVLELAHGRELVALARRYQRILMAGHILEYHPAFQKLVELVHTGELGELRYLYSNRLGPGKIRQQENVLWSLAPHDVDAILRLAGSAPTSVEGQAATYVQPGIPDVATLQLGFPDNVRAHIFVSWMYPFKERKLVAIGSTASAVFDDISAELWVYPGEFYCHDGTVSLRSAAAQRIEIPQREALANECLAFLEAIRTRKPPLSDGESALLTLEVLEQAEQRIRLKGLPNTGVERPGHAAQCHPVH